MMSITEAFRYVLSPRYLAHRSPMDVQAVQHLLHLLFITICLSIVISGLVGSLIMSVMDEIPENVNGTLAETDARQLIILGVLIAPIMEEIIFRSWLGFPRSSVLGFPALICVLALLTGLFLESEQMIILPLAAGLGVLFFILLRRFRNLSDQEIAAARQRLFPLAFWGTLLVFGLSHISNYEGGIVAAFAAPILFLAVLPQIVAGAVLGYVRMRFGLIQAILFHMIYNAVLISIALLAVSLSPPDNPGTDQAFAMPVDRGVIMIAEKPQRAASLSCG